MIGPLCHLINKINILFTLEKSQGWSSWTIKDKYQLSMANHEKEGPPAKRSRCRIPEQSYLSHKEKTLSTESGYKYSTIPCPLDVGDSQATQERGEISWVSPMWLFFTDMWAPTPRW
jgi:hypothetical protein